MHKALPSEPEIERLLSTLGDSPDAIAQSLQSQNCRGDIAASTTCPVASFLRQHFPTQYILVTQYSITLSQLRRKCDNSVRYPSVRLDTPSSVSQFITAFDRKQYPGLIADQDYL